jgi:hypothetical protein
MTQAIQAITLFMNNTGTKKKTNRPLPYLKRCATEEDLQVKKHLDSIEFISSPPSDGDYGDKQARSGNSHAATPSSKSRPSQIAV